MGGRNDIFGASYGTSFEAKSWRSLDPCGMFCVSCSCGVHLFAAVVLAMHTIEGSLFNNFVYLLIYAPIVIFALSSLYMAWSTDPGAVPLGARPLVTVRRASSGEVTPTTPTNGRARSMRRCHKCHDNFKPVRAHHDAVTGRCIVKFDHYCPWVGNAVGALNHKFFVLFIFYTFCACLISLFLILVRAIQCGFVHDDSDDERMASIQPPMEAGGPSGVASLDYGAAPANAHDPASSITNQTSGLDEEDQHRLMFRMLVANYVRQECQGFHESYAVLVLFIVSVVFLIFTCCMLAEQVEAIQTNASKIARMKMRVGQAGTELSRVTEEFNEMFGGTNNDVAWHWFVPIPVKFPRSMGKVVLGYEWDETFDSRPYGLEDDLETGSAVIESPPPIASAPAAAGIELQGKDTASTEQPKAGLKRPPPTQIEEKKSDQGLTKRSPSLESARTDKIV